MNPIGPCYATASADHLARVYPVLPPISHNYFVVCFSRCSAAVLPLVSESQKGPFAHQPHQRKQQRAKPSSASQLDADVHSITAVCLHRRKTGVVTFVFLLFLLFIANSV